MWNVGFFSIANGLPAQSPDSGHWIYEEHPAQTTGLLLNFLKGKS